MSSATIAYQGRSQPEVGGGWGQGLENPLRLKDDGGFAYADNVAEDGAQRP